MYSSRCPDPAEEAATPRNSRSSRTGTHTRPSNTAVDLSDEGRLSLALRRAKVGVFQAHRLLRRLGDPPRPVPDDPARFPYSVYQRGVTIVRAGGDPALEDGKRTNLSLAAPHFHGLVVSPQRPLSFWGALGRVSAALGYRHGMELRGGCIVPTIGGGLCLLSNELFRAGVLLGWDILERHGHTLQAVPPPDDLPWGMDATVFWPHVDLRVAPARGEQWLGVTVIADELRIEVRSAEPVSGTVQLDASGREADGPWRSGWVERTLRAPDGTVIAHDVVATNRKRLLDPPQQARNCLNCGERDCRARPRDLPRRT